MAQGGDEEAKDGVGEEPGHDGGDAEGDQHPDDPRPELLEMLDERHTALLGWRNRPQRRGLRVSEGQGGGPPRAAPAREPMPARERRGASRAPGPNPTSAVR